MHQHKTIPSSVGIINRIRSGVLGTEVAYLDRAMVDFCLSINTRNRKVRPSRIEHFKRAILQGRWHLASTIFVSENGVLMDSQHRLLAIRQLGYPEGLWSFVAYGIDEQAIAAIDEAPPRSTTDLVRLLLNVEVSNMAAEAARAALKIQWDSDAEEWRRQAGVKGYFFRPAIEDVAKWIEVHSESIQAVFPQIPKQKKLSRAGVIAAVVMYGREYPQMAAQFMRAIETGEELTATDARLHLRNWLIKTKGQGSGGDRQLHDVSRTVAAIHDWHYQREMRLLKANTRRRMPSHKQDEKYGLVW